MTLAEVKFNDRHWDSGYYTFSSDRFLVFSTDHSKAMLLLWIFFVIYVLCLSCFHVCSLWPCGHLLGKDWPLDSLVCDVLLCFVTIPYCILGKVWCLIVSIPDLCILSYF